jgi:hypothetical protein
MVGKANFSADQKSRSEDPAWYCLAEFSLSEFVSDQDRRGELTTKLLFQTVREVGLPPECVENIDMTLTGLANEAMAHFKQGSAELPGRIRVFCREKMTAEASSPEASMSCHAEPGMDHSLAIPHPGTKMEGGWGYFLIERGGNLAAGFSASSWNLIDLYLYKEGKLSGSFR